MSKWFYTEDEVNTLLNGKSDTNHNHDSRYYLKTEVDAIEDTLRLAIESLVGFTASIVETLPQTGSSGVMYLVPNDDGVEQDYYTEYIWTDEEKFEKIGNTAVEVDLSGYATISFVNSALADYVTSDELEGLLASKADAVHSHTISDVSGLQSSLDGKAGNSVASSSANGLMSSTDKTKLDGVASGANKTVVDSALSSSSVNPVQNKVVHQELANKAPASHTHPRLVPTNIPENADLNDYTTQGSFYCPMNATATSLANCPTNKAFHLEVYAHAGVRQVLYTYMDNNNWAYERNWSGSGSNGNRWGEWRRIPTDLDITSSILVKSSDIPANADLNTYKTVGFYICGNDNRGTAVNIPSSLVAGGFRLEVLSSANGVTQIIRTYYNTAEQVKLYFRHYYNSGSVWTEWQKVITTAIVDSSLSSTSTNPVQNKVVKSQLDSLNNNKANIKHTHGEAYSATTLRSNTFCQVLGNVAIVSWWSATVNISQTGDWVDLWTLPVTNKGKTVWTENLHNSLNGVLYFKVEEGSNKVQAFSQTATGGLSHHSGQLVFFID